MSRTQSTKRSERSREAFPQPELWQFYLPHSCELPSCSLSSIRLREQDENEDTNERAPSPVLVIGRDLDWDVVRRERVRLVSLVLDSETVLERTAGERLGCISVADWESTNLAESPVIRKAFGGGISKESCARVDYSSFRLRDATLRSCTFSSEYRRRLLEYSLSGRCCRRLLVTKLVPS